MAPLNNYMVECGVTIYMRRSMNKEDMEKVLTYGVHASAVKEKYFVRK